MTVGAGAGPAWDGRVAVVSFSPVARDQRVLRQCAVLAQMGRPPLVVGYADDAETMPFALLRWPVPRPTAAHRLRTLVRKLPAHLGPAAARLGFWAEPSHRWAREQLRARRPALIVANDWPALVVAAAAKAGARLLYDTHEFATRELDESAWWRLVHRPMVRHLERACIGAADRVSTIGPSLAQSLQALYSLPDRPAVIRNIPDTGGVLLARAETAWPLRILYHGNVVPDRGLEDLVDSLPLWTQPHRLTLRGWGPPSYLAALRARASATGCGDRVTFAPAVPPAEVVAAAARDADVGVFFSPLGSIQRRFTLPNKLFEYIAAGLAVAVSPSPDMRDIVERHGIGVVAAREGAPAVAAAINGLSREAVAAFRANSRLAAGVLSWDEEKKALVALLSSLAA